MTGSQLQDRLEIAEVCTRMCWHTDKRQWGQLRSEVFADKVLVDYTSLNGGDAAEVPADELISGWRSHLSGLTSTQHLLTNHMVHFDRATPDAAVATADFQATHLLANSLGGPLWTLGGHYRFTLHRTQGGWRIDGLTMTTAWACGNRQIMERGKR